MTGERGGEIAQGVAITALLLGLLRTTGAIDLMGLAIVNQDLKGITVMYNQSYLVLPEHTGQMALAENVKDVNT